MCQAFMTTYQLAMDWAEFGPRSQRGHLENTSIKRWAADPMYGIQPV